MEDTSKWINTINRERVQERKIHISFLYRLSRVFPCTIWGNLELTWNAGSTLFPSKALGRSVVFPFRYAHGKEGREPLAGSGRIFSVFRGSEMPFSMFSRGKFHKSKHEKTLLSNFVVYFSTFGNTLNNYWMRLSMISWNIYYSIPRAIVLSLH